MLPDWNNVEDIEGFLRRNYNKATWFEDFISRRITIVLHPNPNAPAAREIRLSIDWGFFVANSLHVREFSRLFEKDKWEACAEIIHNVYDMEKMKFLARRFGVAAAEVREAAMRATVGGTPWREGDIYEEVLKNGHIDDVLPDDIETFDGHEPGRENSIPGQAAVEQSVRLGKRDNWWSRLLG